ncbi:hypothetical protein NX059_007797 [Plenodomus lindquistii]|nr:hypothetical protein NX059_007797 [Plenodomus lindquistii]
MFEKAESPENVLESWTLTFHYTEANGDRSLTGIDLSNEAGNKITLSHVKLSVNDLIRKLGASCADLPALPEERYLRVEISYADNRPAEYFAPGFEEPVRDIVRFPSNEDWEQTTINAGLVYTGHHAFSLKGSCLSRTNPDIDNVLPSFQQYPTETSKLDNVELDLGGRARRVELRRRKNSMPKAIEKQDVTSALRDNDNRELRNMLQPSPEPSSTQATQPAPRQQSGHSTATETTKLAFAQTVIDRADRARDLTLPPRGATQIRTVHEHDDTVIIDCACGYSEEEGDMILCQFCYTWQHTHCMGYLGKGDARIPSVYLCYGCLLIDDEQGLIQQSEQAVQRRALWLLQQTSFENAQAFGKAINYTEHEANVVIRTLQQHSLLKKATRRSKWQVALNTATDAQQRLSNIYRNPALGIEHCLLAAPKSSNASSGSTAGRPSKRAQAEIEDETLPVTKHDLYGSGTIGIEATHTPKRARHSRR